MSVSEEKTSTIRDKMMRESMNWNHKTRFGLFSFPGSHHIGDEYKDAEPTKAMNLHPIILNGEKKSSDDMKKSFYAGKFKPKSLHDQVFGETGYLSQNNQYEDPHRLKLFREDYSNPNSTKHDVPFKPTNNRLIKIAAPYKYISDPGNPAEKIPAKRNFLTNPAKRGLGNTTYGHLFSHTKYREDPYERAKMLDTEEHFKHKAKLSAIPFKSNSAKRDYFTGNYQLYTEKNLEYSEKKKPNPSRNIHTAPWRPNNPAKIGFNKTINPPIEYTPEGPELKFRPSSVEGAPWRETYISKSLPTTSVNMYNSMNRPSTKLFQIYT